MQLLQHGANVHYVSNLPEASTALHEAVQRSHDGVLELLLRYGANAFLENGRGMASPALLHTLKALLSWPQVCLVPMPLQYTAVPRLAWQFVGQSSSFCF